MDPSQIYIAIAIVVLAVIAVVMFFVRKERPKKLTPLAGLAFAFIIAGIAFGDSRLVGYSLIGVGVVIAVVDIIKNK
jgi:hypothetical protein